MVGQHAAVCRVRGHGVHAQVVGAGGEVLSVVGREQGSCSVGEADEEPPRSGVRVRVSSGSGMVVVRGRSWSRQYNYTMNPIMTCIFYFHDG